MVTAEPSSTFGAIGQISDESKMGKNKNVDYFIFLFSNSSIGGGDIKRLSLNHLSHLVEPILEVYNLVKSNNLRMQTSSYIAICHEAEP